MKTVFNYGAVTLIYMMTVAQVRLNSGFNGWNAQVFFKLTALLSKRHIELIGLLS